MLSKQKKSSFAAVFWHDECDQGSTQGDTLGRGGLEESSLPVIVHPALGEHPTFVGLQIYEIEFAKVKFFETFEILRKIDDI